MRISYVIYAAARSEMEVFMNYEKMILINQYIKKDRPLLSGNNICQVFKSGDLLEIGFLSKRCRNDAKGSCIMCDYGATESTKLEETYLDKMEEILNDVGNEVNYLLLCANGSILDNYQIPDDLLERILKKANTCHIPNIIIETHFRDATRERLDLIKRSLSMKSVIIEMGLETINERYHKCIFMKNISLLDYENTISLIHEYGFKIELNIMLGIPFVDSREQLSDALSTIEWALDHKCNLVLFPVNIKPFTTLWYIYKAGHYEMISQWLMIILLKSINPKELKRVTIAWYGNREEIYSSSDERTVFPACCPKCSSALTQFYREFMDLSDSHERKALLENLILYTPCNCLEQQMKALEISSRDSFNEKYNSCIRSLEQILLL